MIKYILVDGGESLLESFSDSIKTLESPAVPKPTPATFSTLSKMSAQTTIRWYILLTDKDNTMAGQTYYAYANGDYVQTGTFPSSGGEGVSQILITFSGLTADIAYTLLLKKQDNSTVILADGIRTAQIVVTPPPPPPPTVGYIEIAGFPTSGESVIYTNDSTSMYVVVSFDSSDAEVGQVILCSLNNGTPGTPGSILSPAQLPGYGKINIMSGRNEISIPSNIFDGYFSSTYTPFKIRIKSNNNESVFVDTPLFKLIRK